MFNQLIYKFFYIRMLVFQQDYEIFLLPQLSLLLPNDVAKGLASHHFQQSH